MKKVKGFISFLLVCTLFAAVSISASARASEQIDSYKMNVASTGNGEIAIMFSVTGNGMMERLGAESIRIFERGTYGWELTVLMKMIPIWWKPTLPNMETRFISKESPVSNTKLLLLFLPKMRTVIPIPAPRLLP